jgi:hypothetical protein
MRSGIMLRSMRSRWWIVLGFAGCLVSFVGLEGVKQWQFQRANEAYLRAAAPFLMARKANDAAAEAMRAALHAAQPQATAEEQARLTAEANRLTKEAARLAGESARLNAVATLAGAPAPPPPPVYPGPTLWDALPWVILLTGVVLAGRVFLHARRAAARRAAGLCVGCGYDLRGTPQRCPECGAAAGADVCNR